MDKYAEYEFDQQRLIWYVFCLWDMVFSWHFEHYPVVGAELQPAESYSELRRTSHS